MPALVIGTNNADILYSTGGATVDGLGGRDLINQNLFEVASQTSFNKTLYGRGGDDIINAGFGNDKLLGGFGRDMLRGGVGNDAINGNQGVDTAQYVDSSKAYRISGTAGFATLTHSRNVPKTLDPQGNPLTYWNYSEGRDTLSGIEYLTFNDFYGSQSVVTFRLKDVLSGKQPLSAQGDVSLADFSALAYHNIAGSEASDVLRGDSQRNAVSGNGGNDRLIGAGGSDLLSGGGGADIFVWRDVSDSRLGRGKDIVLDFNAEEGDFLDFSRIDAQPDVVGNQAFRVVGEHGFTGSVGEIAWIKRDGGVQIFLDLDGDTTPEMTVFLEGISELNGASFLL